MSIHSVLASRPAPAAGLRVAMSLVLSGCVGLPPLAAPTGDPAEPPSLQASVASDPMLPDPNAPSTPPETPSVKAPPAGSTAPTADPDSLRRALATRCAEGHPSLQFETDAGGIDGLPAWRGRVRQFTRCVLQIEDHRSIPLDYRVDAEERISEHVVRYRVSYASSQASAGAALRIPAFLFVPDGVTPVPAVIVYHGHGDGKINVAERSRTTENAIGREIAVQYGYVVLAPDAPTFGEFNFADHMTYMRDVVARDPTDTYIAHAVADGERDMEVLHQLARVDGTRIGVAGVSMGSWRALLHSLVYPDVRAVAVAALFVPFGELFSPLHESCQHVHALAMMLRMQDLAAAMSDRAIMIQWGSADGAFTVASQMLLGETQALFETMDLGDRLVVDIDAARGHQFGNAEVGRFMLDRLGVGAREPAAP